MAADDGQVWCSDHTNTGGTRGFRCGPNVCESSECCISGGSAPCCRGLVTEWTGPPQRAHSCILGAQAEQQMQCPQGTKQTCRGSFKHT
mmetsp:Transcript_152902/g.267198  ORF Transcript_152902/g.267198 Transcript_152902/m.267198 type:complete len:89 (+) Transcript_152902:327-593(+)